MTCKFFIAHCLIGRQGLFWGTNDRTEDAVITEPVAASCSTFERMTDISTVISFVDDTRLLYSSPAA
jgi:hypothetical protein